MKAPAPAVENNQCQNIKHKLKHKLNKPQCETLHKTSDRKTVLSQVLQVQEKSTMKTLQRHFKMTGRFYEMVRNSKHLYDVSSPGH